MTGGVTIHAGLHHGPLYLYPGKGKVNQSLFDHHVGDNDGRLSNLNPGFVKILEDRTRLSFVPDGRRDKQSTFGPEDVLTFIYAVFNSPGYRHRFEPMLKLDFPRVPTPSNRDLFRDLANLGAELVSLHLMESPKLDKFIMSYTGPKNPKIGRVGWSDDTVWIDAGKTSAREGHRATKPGTQGFRGVLEEVWNIHIGGYQDCHKWLKDRMGRTLFENDLSYYQQIIVSLSETIRIMHEIDEVIGKHGGWPNAFQVRTDATAVPSG